MDRRRLESAATYLAIVLLGALAVLSVLAVADGLFAWDLLPPMLDKLAVLVLVALGFLGVSCALASLILNLGIVARRLTEISEIVTGVASRERGE